MVNMKINVFSYPENSKRRCSAIKALETLIDILNSKYRIEFYIEVRDGHIAFPQFSRFLVKFLDSCKATYNYIDIEWLSNLNWIINAPNKDTLSIIEKWTGSNFKFLIPFLLEAQDNSENWRSAIGAQFFALNGLNLKPGQGPWGTAHDKYPFSVAIETTGYKESIFHEFLHQFGVSEGYNPVTKATLKGCENCWMQWEATRGNELCERHRAELSNFIQNVKST